MDPAYLEDLAYVHDDSFGFIAEGAAATLVDLLHRQNVHEGLVVELAVGSGISSEILVANGFDVLGYDISPSMIDLATERLSKLEQPQPLYPGALVQKHGAASFEVASLYDAEIPPCVAVTGIGEAFNYKFDPRASFDSFKLIARKAAQAIAPRGIFLFDFAQPGRAHPRLEHHYWEGAGWRVTSETIESTADRLLQRQITTTRTVNGEDRVTKELHTLALYDHEEAFAALTSEGFIPHTLASYADLYRFGLGHGAFAAYKPPEKP